MLPMHSPSFLMTSAKDVVLIYPDCSIHHLCIPNQGWGSLNCCESTCKLYTHTHGLPCLPHFAKPRCAIKIEVTASMKAGQIPRIIPGFSVGGGPDLHLHDLLGIFEAQHGQGSRPGQQSNLTGMGSVALIPVKLGISHICRYIYNWGIRWEVCTYHIYILLTYI